MKCNERFSDILECYGTSAIACLWFSNVYASLYFYLQFIVRKIEVFR